MFKFSDFLEFGTWTFPYFCWGIWKERNKKKFNHKDDPSYILGEMITRNIRKNYQVRKGGENENGGIKKQKEKDRKKKRHDVKCRLPPEGWHKEKFDGASKGNPGTLGCKGVIWNNFGGGVVDFSLPLGSKQIILQKLV